MSGGQGFTAEAGSLGRALTVALAGAAITASAGLVSANNSGVVALIGESTTVAQETIAPSWGQALTGSASTSAAGTITLNLRPTDIVGQAITPSAGTVTASGNGVTVNITGEEITSAQGNVQGGYAFLSGGASTGEQGSYVLSLTLPITGIEATCSAGSIQSTGQDAVDTLLTASQGTPTLTLEVPISGSAITSAAGTVVVSADAFIALTGEASTSAAGTLEYNKQEPLTGSSITSQQNPVGAPGGASLTGSAVTVSAGDVFTTNDRSFALTGESITAQDGTTFASPVCFVDGQEVVSGLGIIGDQSASLTGVGSAVQAGTVTAERGQSRAHGGHGHHRGESQTDDLETEEMLAVVSIAIPVILREMASLAD
jgi:hypothetical protein